MEIRDEVVDAVLSELNAFHMAEKDFPNVPVSFVRACACLGPLPDCSCKKRSRLVQEFIEMARSQPMEEG